MKTPLLKTTVLVVFFRLAVLPGLLQAQVIFKVVSPLKRQSQEWSQQQVTQAEQDAPAIALDSMGISMPDESTKDSAPKGGRHGPNQKSLTAQPMQQANAKPLFLVTYMGNPIRSDTNNLIRYRGPSYRRTDVDTSSRKWPVNRVSSGRGYVDQDSILVAVLEDSLRRIREQIQPLRQSTGVTAKSAFDLYRSIPSILPVRLRSLVDFRISSAYGLRVHPISGRLQNHAGIDLPQPRFTDVYATADGVVDRVVWQPNGMGLAVYIVHPSGYQTGYGHLEDHSVLVGEVVRRGQVIGRVGSTGLSTGPHLHYTVLAGTQPVDPASYCFLLLNALQEPKPRVSRPSQTAASLRR